MKSYDLPKIKRRLWTFESTFQKHADLCEHCYALVIWSLGSPKPKTCRRCQRALSSGMRIQNMENKRLNSSL